MQKWAKIKKKKRKKKMYYTKEAIKKVVKQKCVRPR